jgi:predicted outer membrane protein
MLKTFTAALLATTLIAAPAFAQNPVNTGATPAAPAAQSQPAVSNAGKAAQTETGKAAVKTTTQKSVKHVAKHASKHASRGKTKMVHQARHVKPSKTHQVNAGKPVSETAKRS